MKNFILFIVLWLLLLTPLSTLAKQESSPALPGGLSTVFGNFLDAIQLGFTFDPVQKAEKRLKITQKHVESIKRAEGSTDPEVSAKVRKFVEKAQNQIERIVENQSDWRDKDDVNQAQIVLGIAAYAQTVPEILDQVRDSLPTTHQEAITKLKKAVVDKNIEIIITLKNPLSDRREIDPPTLTVLTNTQTQLEEINQEGVGLEEIIIPPEPLNPDLINKIEMLKKSFLTDKDRDGISDTDEQNQGTLDTEFDSDFDGLSDSIEINIWKTDPTKADTDKDGFTDGVEVLSGYNPLGPGKQTTTP